MVLNLYFVESTLFGLDILLECFFAVITAILAYYAMKIHKLTSDKYTKSFSFSFLFISLSYLIQAFFNFLIVTEITERVSETIENFSIVLFNRIGLYAHMFLMITGLLILLNLTFRTSKSRVFWLLLITSVLTIYFGSNPLLMFFILSSIFLVFIAYYFMQNYFKHKQAKTLLIGLAFLSLLLGQIQFIFLSHRYLFYIIGNILQFIGYLLILWNFLLLRKK